MAELAAHSLYIDDGLTRQFLAQIQGGYSVRVEVKTLREWSAKATVPIVAALGLGIGITDKESVTRFIEQDKFSRLAALYALLHPRRLWRHPTFRCWDVSEDHPQGWDKAQAGDFVDFVADMELTIFRDLPEFLRTPLPSMSDLDLLELAEGPAAKREAEHAAQALANDVFQRVLALYERANGERAVVARTRLRGIPLLGWVLKLKPDSLMASWSEIPRQASVFGYVDTVVERDNEFSEFSLVEDIGSKYDLPEELRLKLTDFFDFLRENGIRLEEPFINPRMLVVRPFAIYV